MLPFELLLCGRKELWVGKTKASPDCNCSVVSIRDVTVPDMSKDSKWEIWCWRVSSCFCLLSLKIFLCFTKGPSRMEGQVKILRELLLSWFLGKEKGSGVRVEKLFLQFADRAISLPCSAFFSFKMVQWFSLMVEWGCNGSSIGLWSTVLCLCWELYFVCSNTVGDYLGSWYWRMGCLLLLCYYLWFFWTCFEIKLCRFNPNASKQDRVSYRMTKGIYVFSLWTSRKSCNIVIIYFSICVSFLWVNAQIGPHGFGPPG